MLQAPDGLVVREAATLLTTSAAWFSADLRYRYLLMRVWSPALPVANWLLLNPSTADELANDPTVERCERRTRTWGYGGMLVTNLFALRSTDPIGLYQTADPCGPANLAVIVQAAQAAGGLICGWGAHASHWPGWVEEVRRALVAAGARPLCLGVTQGGEPRHPLYVPYAQALEVW